MTPERAITLGLLAVVFIVVVIVLLKALNAA